MSEIQTEAKKAKPGEPRASRGADAIPHGFSFSEANDFSKPLGPDNLYHLQGQAAWGPSTGAGISLTFDDNPVINKDIFRFHEAVRRSIALGELDEALAPASSAWAPAEIIRESKEFGGNVWEQVIRWYDHQARGLGLDEKHVGFKKLKGQLAHKKGVTDPGGLAASIGRKKYGAKGMAKKAAAGRK